MPYKNKSQYAAYKRRLYKTQKEAIAIRWHDWRNRLASPFIKDFMFSPEVYDAIKERAPGFFAQDKNVVVDWTSGVTAAVRAELLYAGILVAVGRLRSIPGRPSIAVESSRKKNSKWAASKLATTRQKEKAFDRMVEALDAVEVNGKFLGDCTGADLLRAAVELEEQAREATAQSQFYRQLAAIVGKTVTVRSYNDRAGIIGLITSRYKADE